MGNTSKNVFTTKLKLNLVGLILIFNASISFGQGCPEVPISGIDETQRFSVAGNNIEDDLGESVSKAGDINGDGISDIIIGAPGVDNGSLEEVGEVYVIFGANSITTSSIDINALNGSNGFIVRGVNSSERIGVVVSSAGDINDDGIDDILIGSNGKAIVIFGSTSRFSSTYLTTDINGVNGVILEDTASNTGFGQTLSNVGDINNDGVDDIIIGASNSSGSGISQIGNAYVFYGSSAIGSMNVSILNGSNGFKIEGFLQNRSGGGLKVSNAGDINDDGLSDVIIGYPSYEEGTAAGAGRVALVFGSITGFLPVLSLSSLDGSNGFIMTGNVRNTRFGSVVADAKDFNGDGIDDVAITTNNQAYVVYGKRAPFDPSIRISDVLIGDKFVFEAGWYQSPYRIADIDGVSDVNNDGVTDLLISSPHFDGYARSGSVYVIYGSTTLPSTMQSLEITGNNGYHIFDDLRYSYNGFGHSVSDAGDFNNDGTNDFIVGERINNSDIYRKNGAAHVFFGNTLDVIDGVAPTINCPRGTQELYANSVLPNYIHFLSDVNDDCSYNTDMTYTQTPSAGTLFTGSTNVTITVIDRSGNTNSCMFTVNLKTTTAEIDCSTTTFSVNNLDGTNGLILYGEKPHSETGRDVNTAGDVNGDGIDDFIVVAKGDVVNHTGPYRGYHIDVAGGVYIVFGTNSGFPPNIDLGNLNGSDGFKINNNNLPHNRTSDDNQFYKADTAGDINRDGFDDIILSEPFRGNSSGGIRLGYVYVIFGTNRGFSSDFDLSTLNGANGFTITGTDRNGFVGMDLDNLGDVNGDNIDDIILANIPSSPRFGAPVIGKCFVIFGTDRGFSPSFDLTGLNGTNGFVITSNGPTTEGVGRSIAGLGDVNGDNVNDIAIGGNKNRKFVVFGRSGSSSFPATLNVEDLNGTNGFAVEHSVATLTNQNVENANDVNNDGLNDIIFGNQYVLFGNSTFPAVLDLESLDGTNGFSFSRSGRVFSFAGDFNNDNYDDLIYGDFSSQYLIYGRETWQETISTTPSVSSYRVNIELLNNNDIVSASYAGDVNNDGIDDLVLGHFNQFSYNYAVNVDPGFAYVIFGQDIPDIDAPEITDCLSDQTLSSGSNLPDYTSSVRATDDCDTNLEITQSPEAGTRFTANTTVTITVTDNSGKEDQCTFEVRTPTPTVDLSVSSNTGTEDAGTVITVTATSSSAVVGDQTIDLAVTGTGITGTDFTLSNTTITILDGMTTGTVTFTIEDDALVESIETATLTISNPSLGITLGTITTQDITITDNDSAPLPTVNLSVSPNTGTEAAGTVITVTATSSTAVAGDQTIDLATTGTGITGTDFTLSGTTITIADGMTTGTVTFTIEDDAVVEGTETATLTISNPSSGIMLGTTTTQDVVITDNDIPSVNLSVSPNTGTEAAGTVITVTATSSSAVVGDQTIDLAVTGTGITGTDFTLSGTRITIADGMTTGTVTFTIEDDALVESTETATLTISNPSPGITLGTITTQDITITDNDSAPLPTVNLSVSPNTGTEAAGTVITVTATSSTAVVGDQTIDLATTGTGITATDFTLSGTTITIADGMTTGTVTFTIEDDAVVEGTETATLTISNPSPGITLGTITTQDITITDNDSAPLPTVNLSVSPNTGTEAAGTVITVTATSSTAVVGDQTIDLATTGTGITATDFTLSGTRITIADGMTTGTVTFTIEDDAVVEGTETATLTISNPSSGIMLGTTTTQDVVITDNDIPSVNLSVSPNTGTEAAGTVITVTATSSTAVVGDQTIDLATTGTGITATDFTLSGTRITIADGMTTGTVTFTIEDDAVVEGTETATLTISNPSSGIMLGTTTTQDVVITDNDIPSVNLSVSPNTGTEAAGTVITVTATSSTAVVGDQTIDLATTGTGITATDFTLSGTTITIANGMTTGTVTFTIVDDADVEGTETATLTISNPSSGITLGTITTQDVVITDNDLAICTIEAGEDQEIVEGQEIQLNAMVSNPGTLIWSPSRGLSNTNITDPIANPTETTTYTLLFTGTDGCTAEDMVTVFVTPLEEDQTRYGFSPDDDGINEYWEINGIDNYPNNKVLIYNRWGDLVFEVDGYNNTSRVFRGIANRKRSLGGDKLPEGTYFFDIKIEGAHNLKKETGFLVLKR